MKKVINSFVFQRLCPVVASPRSAKRSSFSLKSKLDTPSPEREEDQSQAKGDESRTSTTIRLLGVIAGGTLAGWQLLAHWEEHPAHLLSVVSDAVLSSTAPAVAFECVPRPAYEDFLTSDWIGRNNGMYLVIVGPSGCGKTTTLNKSVEGKPGIIWMRISHYESQKQLCIEVLETVCVKGRVKHKKLTMSNFATIDSLAEVLYEAAKKKRLENSTPADWVPTIVVHIQRNDEAQVHSIIQVFKELCCDKRACAVLFVVNDALVIPDDVALQEILYFNDWLTMSEASMHLDQLGILVDEKSLRKQLFDILGRMPQDFVQLARKIRSARRSNSKKDDQHLVDEFLRDRNLDAENRVRTFLDISSSQLQSNEILDLVTKLVEDGMRRESEGKTHDNALPEIFYTNGPFHDPKLLCGLMKDKKGSQAVMYHFPSKTWRFHSPACFEAAKRLVKAK
jgi:hypothetical protein